VASDFFGARTLTMPWSPLAMTLSLWSTTVVFELTVNVSVRLFSVFCSKFELLTVIETDPLVVVVAACSSKACL
jgi:hypothetical protein